jgi:hypothetical protein
MELYLYCHASSWRGTYLITGGLHIYFREIGREDLYWIYLAQDRDMWWALGNTVMNL